MNDGRHSSDAVLGSFVPSKSVDEIKPKSKTSGELMKEIADVLGEKHDFVPGNDEGNGYESLFSGEGTYCPSGGADGARGSNFGEGGEGGDG